MEIVLQSLTMFGVATTVLFFVVYAVGLNLGVREARNLPKARLDVPGRTLVFGARVAFFAGIATVYLLTVLNVSA